MNRQFWVVVHRYAGLYMAVFLIVASLTGSILAFRGEIDQWLNPPEQVALKNLPRLDEISLLEKAEQLLPNGKIYVLQLNRKPEEAYRAQLAPRMNASGDLTANFINLDPYSGAEISRGNLPAEIWPVTRQNFINLIISLHYRLAIPGSVGVWLFGIAALIWTVDCFVSAYLTFPLAVKKSENSRRTPLKSWLSRWKPAWMIKYPASTIRIHFDLHRAGGLWTWLLLLVLAWSSVGFNLDDQVYFPVMKKLFAMPNLLGDLPQLPQPKEYPELTWRPALSRGRELMAAEAVAGNFKILREEMLLYRPDTGVYLYMVKSDRDLATEIGNTFLLFDAESGQNKGVFIPSGYNPGCTIHSWIFALHMAAIWGLPYKIFLAVIGLVISLLSITGVYIWYKKRKARISRLKKMPYQFISDR